MSVPFWTSDFTILIKKDNLKDIWPTKEMSDTEASNAVTRLILFLTILGVIITQSLKLLVTGLITIGIIVFIHKNKHKKKNKKEGFSNIMKEVANSHHIPTKQNPFGNAMLTEIHDNPKRKPAASLNNPIVEKEVKDTFKKTVADLHGIKGIDERLFADLGDSFELDLSLRQFYTMPNTTIPNDQDAFAKFCYGDMISCKEGSDLACSQKNLRFKGN